jgi:hypothetical protein
MKFDIQLPNLKGIARVEIKTTPEDTAWAAYLSLAMDRLLRDTCLLLGSAGIPYRFTGASEKEAEEKAKDFLRKNYAVVRMVWS